MQTCWSSSCAPLQQPPVASRVGYCRRRRVVLQTVQKMPLNGADVVHETRRCTKQGVLLSVSSDPRRETVCVDLLVVILCVPSTIAGRLSRAFQLSSSTRCPANSPRNAAQWCTCRIHETIGRCTSQGVLLSLSSDRLPRGKVPCLLVVILCVSLAIAGRLALSLLSASARCPVHGAT